MPAVPRRPPFRAEHLGSLLRPEKLLKARNEFEAKKRTEEQLVSAEDEAIKNIVHTQLDIGFRAVSDGEYRSVSLGPLYGFPPNRNSRGVFWGTFFQDLEGMEEVMNPPLEMFRTYVPDIAGFLEKGGPGQSCVCKGKIRHTGKSSLVGQFNYVKSLLPKERWGDIKLTLISPVWYHLRYKDGHAFPKDVYNSDEEYFADIAKAYNTELDILYEAGVRNIQIDDPNFAYFCSEKMVEGWAADTTNSRSLDALLDLYIDTYNKCIDSHKDKIHFGLHICRGNFRGSRHFSEGGYDRIATKLFQKMDVQTFYLEYDTPRAGNFEPLRNLPAHKRVVLGVITSKFPKLENKDEMKTRVLSAAEIMASGSGQSKEEALDRLSVSPQCGFASHEEGNSLGMEDMKKKLGLVRELAYEIWPDQP